MKQVDLLLDFTVLDLQLLLLVTKAGLHGGNGVCLFAQERGFLKKKLRPFFALESAVLAFFLCVFSMTSSSLGKRTYGDYSADSDTTLWEMVDCDGYSFTTFVADRSPSSLSLWTLRYTYHLMGQYVDVFEDDGLTYVRIYNDYCLPELFTKFECNEGKDFFEEDRNRSGIGLVGIWHYSIEKLHSFGIRPSARDIARYNLKSETAVVNPE